MVNTQRIPATSNATTDTAFRVIGTRPVRHDEADKVTGWAKFGGDFHSAGLLHGKVLRSPHAHARIISIDTGRAEALDGVRAVVPARDFPQAGNDELAELKHWNEGFTKLHYLHDNILANEKILYHGHAVAAVAATSQHVAEEALDLISVEYEPLPPVLTIEDALRNGAPVLHDDLPTKGNAGPSAGPTNLAEKTVQLRGDPDRAFAQADVIVERSVNTSTVHQGYIEPHSSTVYWNKDGQVKVWTSTQGAFYVREMLAIILDIPESQIHCVPMEIGGGFGGKFEQYTEPAAALLSRKTGRPVKMTMSRIEEFKATGPAPGASIRVRMGATNDGMITAVDARLAYESGAYPDTPISGGIRKLTDQ